MVDKNTWNQRKWSLLSRDLRGIHHGVIAAWEKLISDETTNERKCLEFVRDHAALFFQRSNIQPIVISELSLGSDYRVDFVIVTEGFSGGTTYKLIEFESPNSKLYKSNGKSSSRLSEAIDQVLEWRRWISQHRSQARKIFPSIRWGANAQPTFTYQIVIGRRNETELVQDKIWSRIHDQAIEVVSYDRLTNLLRYPFFDDRFPAEVSSEGQDYLNRPDLLNLAACPFTKAVPDAVWRKLTSEHQWRFGSHIIPPYLDLVVSEKRVNTTLLNQFDLELAKRVESDN